MSKKILSIDGCGIKGVFPASFLAAIEETTGKKISNYFDLMVGTSTGGIVALGLGMGFSDTETTDESILNGAAERIKGVFDLVELLDSLHYEKLTNCIQE